MIRSYEPEWKNELIIYTCENIHFTISKKNLQCNFPKGGMGSTMETQQIYLQYQHVGELSI